MSVCIFCLRAEGNLAEKCTYGMNHELDVASKPKQEKKRNTALCVNCGMHPKNPAFAASECKHEFREGD